MASRAVTLSGRWGEAAYAQFDYWRNPTRIGVDADHPNGQNPCLFVRHGGAGVTGDHGTYRTDAFGDPFYAIHWLGGAQAGSNPSPRWDVCSFSSGQEHHIDFYAGTGLASTSPQPRSLSLYFPDAIRDCQRAISAIKGQHVALGFNPRKVVGWGDSYGATVMGLGQLIPPLGGNGRRRIWRDGVNLTSNHDSTLRALVYHIGQPDCRNISGTDQIHYFNCGGWFGTRTDVSTEFDALPDNVKELSSIIAYLEAGGNDIEGCRNWLVAWATGIGDGIKPYGRPGVGGSDIHDTAQHTNLVNALTAAGITHGSQLRGPDEWRNTNWPGEPPATQLALYQALNTHLAAAIA